MTSISEAMLSLKEYEYEVLKTEQLQQVLNEMEAERDALLRHVVYYQAVLRARGFDGHMFQQEKAQADLLNPKWWSARLMVEQRHRDVHPVRRQKQQLREKESDAAVWWERENRNSARTWTLIAEQARQADEERETRETGETERTGKREEDEREERRCRPNSNSAILARPKVSQCW